MLNDRDELQLVWTAVTKALGKQDPLASPSDEEDSLDEHSKRIADLHNTVIMMMRNESFTRPTPFLQDAMEVGKEKAVRVYGPDKDWRRHIDELVKEAWLTRNIYLLAGTLIKHVQSQAEGSQSIVWGAEDVFREASKAAQPPRLVEWCKGTIKALEDYLYPNDAANSSLDELRKVVKRYSWEDFVNRGMIRQTTRCRSIHSPLAVLRRIKTRSSKHWTNLI